MELLQNGKTKTLPSKSSRRSTLTMVGPNEEKEDNRLMDIFKKYSIETSMHGPKYIFENKRHPFERLFWVIAVSLFAACGSYLIYQVSIQHFHIKIIFTCNSIFSDH